MIVKLMGGIGNQLFHYALGRSVSLTAKDDLFFTRDFFNLGPKDGLFRSFTYCLHEFNILDMKFVNRLSGHVMHDEPVFQFHPDVFKAPKGSSFDGPWQSEKYFVQPWAGPRKDHDIEGVIRHEFTLKNPPSYHSIDIADEIVAAGKRSMFLHVRRGDYLIPKVQQFHGAPTMRYYKEAVDRMRSHYEDAKFYVFSDDPEWCRANFPSTFTIVDHNKPSSEDGKTQGREHEDLWLMGLCHNAAIANSSFSWWGAWMGDAKKYRLVFAPQDWLSPSNPQIRGDDVVPERWVKLAN